MPVMSTLRFVPGIRRFRRGEALLQFGLHETRAKLIPLPDPRLYPALAVLDTGRDRAGFISEAKRNGVPKPEAEALLDLLQAEGLLVDTRALSTPGGPLTTECRALALRGPKTNPAELMRHRATVTIDVEGQSPSPSQSQSRQANPTLLTTLVTELKAAGLTRTRGGEATRSAARSKPALSILIDVPRPAGLVAYAYRRRGIPHLVVTRMDGIVRIGPLVIPTTEGACGNCVDLHRHDHNAPSRPGGPGGLGGPEGLGGPGEPGGPTGPGIIAPKATGDEEELLERAVRSMAVGLLTTHILTHVDGGRSPLISTTMDVTPAGITPPTTWDPHPKCGCRS